jgi:hypothetical protein
VAVVVVVVLLLLPGTRFCADTSVMLCCLQAVVKEGQGLRRLIIKFNVAQPRKGDPEQLRASLMADDEGSEDGRVNRDGSSGSSTPALPGKQCRMCERAYFSMWLC